jgi:uncharacterized membrane protein YccF (DUF307 family)
MSTITKTWVAFAAIGTGLIHFALVIGAPLGLGLALAALAFLEFGWGVLTFARDTVASPRVALVFAIVPVLLWGLLLVISTIAEMPGLAASLPFIPFAVATIFELFIACVLAVHLRRDQEKEAPQIPSVGRYLLSLIAGALLVAGLTTPALAATQAGQLATPHGDTVEFELPDHDGGH